MEHLPHPSVEPSDVESVSVAPAVRVPNPRFFRFLIGGIAALVVLGVALSVSAAVYLLPTTDPFVRSVTSRIPYPIAVVDGRVLTFRAFFEEQDALERYLLQAGAEQEIENFALLQEQILNAMIDRVLVEQMAADRGIALDQAKVDAFLASASEQSGSEDAFFQEIEASLGWDKEAFVSHIMEPIVLAGQVQEQMYADATQQSEARSRIEAYLSRIRAGEAFADVFASTDGEDDIAGGEWGYLTQEQMPEAWQSVVPGLALNVVSDVIELPDAYSIVQVSEQIEAAEDIQYRINTIIVAKYGMDEAMETYRADARIWRFLKT